MATHTDRVGMKRGFALPMAMLVTVISVIFVGAMTTYCTSALRTSEIYLSRTRCRLAAQSAIEVAKMRLQDEITKSGKGGLIADPTNANFAKGMNDLAKAVNDTFRPTTNINGCVVRLRAGTAGTESGGAIVPFYATATRTSGGTETSVTLQECVKFRIADTSVYDYAYFANSDGFLETSYVTVNGDVRANGNFTINAAQINGYIYATNVVNLVNSPKILTTQGYNSEFNKDGASDDIISLVSGNDFYYKSYSQVRPTNPLYPSGSKVEWKGGFEGIEGNSSLAQTITKSTRSAAPNSKAIVSEKQPLINLPIIEGFGNETGLGYYKNYAALQHGSLICSNCTVQSDGSLAQLKTTAMTLTYTETYVEEIDDPAAGYDYISGSTWKSRGEPDDWTRELTLISLAEYKTLNANDRNFEWQQVKLKEYKKSYGGHSQDYYDWKTYLVVYYRGDCYRVQYKRVKKKQITKTRSKTGQQFRELRAIRVREGYQIDHTGLAARDRDLSGTTANLRPFRAIPAEANTDLAKIGMTSTADKGAVILIGTWDFPITLNGPVVFESDVLIRGFVQGRGTIYSGRNIHIIGDINYKNAPKWTHENSGSTLPSNTGCDFLALISKGSIVFGNYVSETDWTDADGIKQYISGNKTDDITSSRRYTKTNYTIEDSSKNASGARYQKVVYSDNKFTQAAVKKYESVVGDWVFDGTTSSLVMNYDENANASVFGKFSDEVAASYLSGPIENYLNERNRNLSYRKNTRFATFLSDFGEYCGAFASGKYASSTGNRRPLINCIRTVNAVLYSGGGIFGTFGGKGGLFGLKSFATINGAVIGQDECIIPFARRYNKCNFTINWDMRLGSKSAEAFNDPGLPKSSGGGENTPYTFSWQEVPADYNTIP